MASLKLFTSVFVIFLAELCHGQSAYPILGHTKGVPWPMPKSYKTSPDQQILDKETFIFAVTGKNDCDLLQQAFRRYYKIIFYPGWETDPSVSKRQPKQVDDVLRFEPTLKGRPYGFPKRWQRSAAASRNLKLSVLPTLSVYVAAPCEQYPSLEMDESYNLSIAAGVGKLSSNSVWGALRGLETFSQLVYEADIGTRLLNNTEISDSPRFPHRGAMLDTSRHYVPKIVLLENLDAMMYNKLNVFHWHIVDDESFPYQSRVFPALSLKGAYEPYTHTYTQEDIAEVIEYARVRGIRVIPEFDSPGHSESWGKGQPGLLTECYTAGKPNGNFGPIDPSKDTTYTFLRTLFTELRSVFKDHYLHLGGDEVNFNCWKSNPNITAFMKAHNLTGNYAGLESYYENKLLDILNDLKSGYMVWQEVIDNGCKVRPDTVAHVWKSSGYKKELAKVTLKGHRTILSAAWYLNYISYGTDWPKYYAVEPLAFNGTAAQKALIMGGEACIWGEYVDGSNLISRFWPRASAVAERLWSAASVRSKAQAEPRIEEHRCRMVRRGINAEPPTGPGYCRYEPRISYSPIN